MNGLKKLLTAYENSVTLKLNMKSFNGLYENPTILQEVIPTFIWSIAVHNSESVGLDRINFFNCIIA